MKKLFINKPFFFFSMFLLVQCIGGILSCKKEIYYEWPKGTLKGTVWTVSSTYNIERGQGVLVKVEGSSPLAQATSDENGNFAIENLETGIYDIVFSKAGYQTITWKSYQFVGGNVPFYLNGPSLIKESGTSFTIAKPDVSDASNSRGYSNTLPHLNNSTIQFHPTISFNKP